MSHGHDEHGHGAGPAPEAAHGPAELPPEPAVRSISPAPEDYAQPWPGRGMLWPFVWLVAAAVFLWAACRFSGEVETAGHGAGGAHAAPAEAHPEGGGSR